MNDHLYAWKSPYGELLLASRDGALIMCDWRYRKAREKVNRRLLIAQEELAPEPDAVIDQAIKELQSYFEGKSKTFEVPMRLIGSTFQIRVWEKLLEIPYGKTMSYLELSKAMKQPEAIRAIAAANGANALSIIVPCHRIIGSEGELTGYAGGLTAKAKLLQLENPNRGVQQNLF